MNTVKHFVFSWRVRGSLFPDSKYDRNARGDRDKSFGCVVSFQRGVVGEIDVLNMSFKQP